ncbi:hypothetical protein GCM10027614_01800 [Micromonospora vulcania]
MPSTPDSLVKLARRLCSLSTGASSSTPTSDQVPQEMYAKCAPVAGTPTTAEAVSCDPTATTAGSPGSPSSGRTGPIRVPASRSGGNNSLRIPASRIRSVAQARRRRSYSWVVEALVTSAPTSPVSQYAMRSGISSSRWATSSCGVPVAATSW